MENIGLGQPVLVWMVLDKEQSWVCRWDHNWSLTCNKDITWRFVMQLESRLGVLGEEKAIGREHNLASGI